MSFTGPERLFLEEPHLLVVIRILAERVPSVWAYAFGSRVRAEDGSCTARAHSDLDIVLCGEEKLAFPTILALRSDFEDSTLPFFVDVLDWNDIPESFRKEIRKNNVLLRTPERKFPSPLGGGAERFLRTGSPHGP